MIKSTSQPAALLAWMDALADATRLRLLRLLERHELGVIDLCDVLQLPQSTVSRHLKVLADQGWVRSRRQSTTHLYRMILDELDPATRKLWLLAREQTDEWATVQQDELRLLRRLKDRQKDSEAFFAGAAGEWDRLRLEMYGENFGHQAMLALLPGDYIIADLGCGSGGVTAELAQHVGRIYAIDNSPPMLKAAKKRIGDRDNVELKRGDLEAIPLDDQSCDAAIMLLVLSYVAEPVLVLKEMARILKPAGKAVLVDLLPHDRDDFRRQMGQLHLGFSSEHMSQMMTDAAMPPIHWRALESEPMVKGPALFLAVGQKNT
ncbi:MAG TPA: metalloregulator ArsR/SmtB family transcription factor [Tepidisphaeraceae bacterium]|jgi:ArsR family transcriptional regulator|nr:metalloregulator ArsR/SmtB family transcription factor [Tepidisphaeraceae bacterium]